jgi:predicted permease
MGNPLLAGRDFTWADVHAEPTVVVMSAGLARQYWKTPGEALGKRVRESPKSPWRTVIGVVGDERDDGVAKKAPEMMYWPLVVKRLWDQEEFVARSVAYAIRSPRTGTQDFLNEVRQAVWSVNSNLPLANVRTLEKIYKRSMARTSFTLVMLGIAGGTALLLGLVGIYGVISYSVSQRTREIGIRMALGAERRDVQRMFVSHGLRLTLIGIAAGAAAAAALTRGMSTLLYGVSAIDPLTYAAVAAVLAGAALAASYLPARRATGIDPSTALRME